MKSYGFSGEVNWELVPTKITSITAYRWWDWYPANDVDATPLAINVKAQQAKRQRQFSQEIRLASQGKNTIDYVVGAYYFWQIIRGYGAFAYGPDAALWNLPTTPAIIGNAALNGFEARSTSNPQTKSFALFGQATWNISNALSLTGGLRWTHEKKRGTFDQYWFAGDDLSGLTPAQQAAALAIRTRFNPITHFDVKLSDNSLSGLASVSWKFARDSLVYATYSRGNKAGGLNLTVIPAGAIAEVKPEKVDSFELGIKTKPFDSLTFNAAAFWTAIRDYQTLIAQQNSAGFFIQYIANIPKVRSRGFEADVAWSPSKWVNLTASAAYTEAQYRNYKNAPLAPEQDPALYPLAVQDLSGVQLPGIPKYSLSLGADVAQPLAETGKRTLEVYGHADFSYRSHFNTSSMNSRYADVPG